ncbi:UNVERIFIED_ORG: putative membrane protein [Xanthomonas campestris]
MKVCHPMFAALTLCLGIIAAAHAQNATQAGMPATAQQQAGTNSPSAKEREALGTLSAINTSEIGAANPALQKQVQGGVRDYAMQMVKEHTDNNQKLAKWSPDLSAAAAKAQMSKAKTELAVLQKLEGKAFEAAYVTAMVKDHTDALAALDKQLIPVAKTAQVLAHLQTTRSHVAEHLAAAKTLQASSKGAGR